MERHTYFQPPMTYPLFRLKNDGERQNQTGKKGGAGSFCTSNKCIQWVFRSHIKGITCSSTTNSIQIFFVL